MTRIDTPSELAAEVRARYLAYDGMEVDPDKIARALLRDCTFGYSFPGGRGGKVGLSSLKLAVDLVLGGDERFDGETDYTISGTERADEILDALRTLAALDAPALAKIMAKLSSLDREHFSRLLANYVGNAQEGLRRLAPMAADREDEADEPELDLGEAAQ